MIGIFVKNVTDIVDILSFQLSIFFVSQSHTVLMESGLEVSLWHINRTGFCLR